jgi:hypothetical protein
MSEAIGRGLFGMAALSKRDQTGTGVFIIRRSINLIGDLPRSSVELIGAAAFDIGRAGIGGKKFRSLRKIGFAILPEAALAAERRGVRRPCDSR